MEGENRGEGPAGGQGEKPRITVRYGSEQGRPRGTDPGGRGSPVPADEGPGKDRGVPYALLLRALLDKSPPERAAPAPEEGVLPAPGGVERLPGAEGAGGGGQGAGARQGGGAGAGGAGTGGGAAAPGAGKRVRSLEAMVDDIFQISRRMQSTAVYLKALVTLLSVSPTEFADMIGEAGGKAPDVTVESLARLVPGRSRKDLSELLALAQSPGFMEAAEELLKRIGASGEHGGETKRGQS